MIKNITEFVFSNSEFKELYELYDFQKEIVDEIKKRKNNIFLKIFASSTCQYCKIYIPEMLKIHEYVEFNIEFICWEDQDEDKQINLMDDFNLTGLPTIIIYKVFENKKTLELGRIVKEPKKTIEEDVLIILELDRSE